MSLSPGDRIEALGVAADRSGRPVDLLEKDVWVVWVLDILFNEDYGNDLTFKGGTSLSKAYAAIRRFSEDVDLTYDIRALLPEETRNHNEGLPATRNQQRKWSSRVNEQLPRWIDERVLPVIREHLAATGASGEVRAERSCVFLKYAPEVAGAAAYIRREVMIEFGARSTGEPSTVLPITCDAAAYLPEIAFPTARPRVMVAERTFWEKATAIHVYCLKGRARGERYSRHWYDLVCLDEAGIADRALADRILAESVAIHKGWFFAEKDHTGNPIDYAVAIGGALRLVPEGEARKVLEDDYERMVAAGLLELNAAPRFVELLDRCSDIQERANRTAVSKAPLLAP